MRLAKAKAQSREWANRPLAGRTALGYRSLEVQPILEPSGHLHRVACRGVQIPINQATGSF